MAKLIQVFLSYASEDRDEVNELYGRLSDAGYGPWMDKRNILPGEQWELTIYSAIRRADFFLACVSPRSVGKRGFLQKEIKQALSYWQEKLNDDIYVIPVRLEPCEAPEPLNQFEWVDLFEPEGFARLCQVLDAGAARIRKDKERLDAARSGISIRQLEFQDVRREKPQFDVNIQYPHLEGPSGLGLDEVSLHLAALIRTEAMLCRSIVYSTPITIMGEDVVSSCYVKGESQVTLADREIISVMIDFFSFRYPAAHGNKWRTGVNYGLNPATLLHLDELFDANTNYCEELAPIVYDKIGEIAGTEASAAVHLFDTVPARLGMDHPAGAGSFNLTPDSIIMSYDAPFAVGVVQTVIPYSQIKHLLNPTGPLKRFRD